MEGADGWLCPSPARAGPACIYMASEKKNTAAAAAGLHHWRNLTKPNGPTLVSDQTSLFVEKSKTNASRSPVSAAYVCSRLDGQ